MTNTPETMALAPCPFCGGEATVYSPTCTASAPYDPGDRAFPEVQCLHCYASAKGENWDHACKTAIAAWNRRADTRPAPAAVMALEWGAQGTWCDQPSYHADSAFGWLMIVDHTQHGNGFRVYPPWEETKESHPTLEAAKAAAQADYNARILSALQPAPAVEGLLEAAENLANEVQDLPDGPYHQLYAALCRYRVALAAYEESRK